MVVFINPTGKFANVLYDYQKPEVVAAPERVTAAIDA